VPRALSLSTYERGAIERARDLTARAHRLRGKGELRRASVALREACALDEHDAARWLWFSNLLAGLGKRDEAEQAMKQALFLRQKSGEKAKANVIRGLLLQLARVH
jgi:tetratricopeptide (TPR) repeat protein